MKVAIITDSNSGITIDEAKALGITVVPTPFLIDGKEYLENVDLTQEQFYEKLTGKSVVSTSQPNIYEISETWKELLETYDEIVYIPLSSGLSASCSSTMALSSEFNGKVHVVDNKRISVTQKQSVFDAVELAKEGKSALEIKNWLEKTSKDSSIYIMVNTLTYLRRGGRITAAAAALGSLLKIKPVLTIQGDKLDKFMQVVSANLGRRRMIDQIDKELSTRFDDLVKKGKVVVDVAYTNCEEKAQEFKAELNEMLNKYGLVVNRVEPLSLAVACHIGDGSIAVAITRKY